MLTHRAALVTALFILTACQHPAETRAKPEAPAPPAEATPASSKPADTPTQPIEISKELIATPISGTRAWLITHTRPIPANSLLYITASGEPVLADTPWTPAATRELMGWVEETFGAPIALATISHFHLDASGGISALNEANIPTLSSEATAAAIASRAESMRESLAEEHGEMFEGWTTALPTQTFDPTTPHERVIGGTTIQVIFPGEGHARDNVVTWFPQERVLFGGCLVKGGDDLGYLGDANVTAYAASVGSLEELAPRVVVSGHGDRLDAGQIAHTHDLAVHAAEGR